MEGVERLSLVSKVLFDSRLCELKRENEDLKLRVFWLQHSLQQLAELTQRANCSESGPRCSCFECLDGGRFHPWYSGPGTDRCVCNCTFKPWFEEFVTRCGMSVGLHKEPDAHLWCTESECPRARFPWRYGTRLTDARSEHAELHKLKELFAALEAVV
jgi:hypothetical protein